MNRSSGPRKRADLCNSTQQYLNMYAIAASAAGVGMLALAQPGAAKIVNTPTHHIIDKNDIYHLDLNHDGIIDFSFVNTHACGTDMCLNSLRVSPSGRENGAAGTAIPFLISNALTRCAAALLSARSSRSLGQSWPSGARLLEVNGTT